MRSKQSAVVSVMMLVSFMGVSALGSQSFSAWPISATEPQESALGQPVRLASSLSLQELVVRRQQERAAGQARARAAAEERTHAEPTAEQRAVIGRRQTGIASWYGGHWHGRETASGETFDKEELTAAHRTLPFGSYVRVRNLRNQREVVVRITDRGPFRRGRIIDLSEEAARRLGIRHGGLAHVELEVVPGR